MPTWDSMRPPETRLAENDQAPAGRDVTAPRPTWEAQSSAANPGQNGPQFHRDGSPRGANPPPRGWENRRRGLRRHIAGLLRERVAAEDCASHCGPFETALVAVLLSLCATHAQPLPRGNLFEVWGSGEDLESFSNKPPSDWAAEAIPTHSEELPPDGAMAIVPCSYSDPSDPRVLPGSGGDAVVLRAFAARREYEPLTFTVLSREAVPEAWIRLANLHAGDDVLDPGDADPTHSFLVR